MIKVLLFSALLAMALSISVEQQLLQEDPAVLKQWEAFLLKHRPSYENSDEMYKRFNVFKKNLNIINWQNQMDPGAEYGVTQFADLSKQEFAKKYLTLHTPEEDENRPELDIQGDAPASFDWRDHGAVTAVKNQGSCGSCWAFSTIANIEGQYFLQGNTLTSFSEQQLVDCDKKTDEGCNGGLMSDAFTYLEANGFETESDYPYEGVDDKCKVDTAKEVEEVKGFDFFPKDAKKIAAGLAQTGPLSAAINAGWFQFYIGGISDPPFLCNPKALDHGITLVGYGNGKTLIGKSKDFWLIKNSWGKTWGEKGYIKLVRGKGKCGIDTNVLTSHL